MKRKKNRTLACLALAFSLAWGALPIASALDWDIADGDYTSTDDTDNAVAASYGNMTAAMHSGIATSTEGSRTVSGKTWSNSFTVNGEDITAGVDGGSKTGLDHMSLITGFSWRYGGVFLAAYFDSGFGEFGATARFRQSSINSHHMHPGGEWSYESDNAAPPVDSYALDIIRTSVKAPADIDEAGIHFASLSGLFTTNIGVEGLTGKKRGLSDKALVGFSF